MMERISKKAYAAIKTAQDDMLQIQKLAADLKVTNSYTTAKTMSEIANKYMTDFADVDPAWTPAYIKNKIPQYNKAYNQ